MESALQLHGVGKRYRDFRLEDASFTLPRGFIMGLIGPNGAGKTTLIKLVLNLVRRDAGRIEVLGRDNLRDEVEIKSRIGYVPDEPRFPEDVTLLTLKRATTPFYPWWNEGRFEELARSFRLPMDKRFKKLSHGTKTKFALALALSRGAELVLLDEPTSGLDPVFRRELLGLLSELLQDERVAVLFSTHITADLERIADYITFLKDGRVVFSRSKDEVLGSFGVVKGGREMLADSGRELLEGVRVHQHGFEGLTSRIEDARRCFPSGVVIEPATLDDVMVLMERKADHAA